MIIKPEYRIGIIGCGKMGKDLFEFLTGFPFHITLVCRTDSTVEQIKSSFEKKQKRSLKYQIIDQKAFEFCNQNTMITSDQNQLSNCDLVIESITENPDRKQALYRQLETIIKPECILASNTSSISIDQLFAGIINEKRCLGLHFFFPIGMKDIVEVNLAKNTSSETIGWVKGFLTRIEKFNIILAENDQFIINRIFLKMQAGCCQLLKDSELNIEQIDAIVKAHLLPFGVFEFFDNVGNDVMLQSVKNYINYESKPQFYQLMLEVLEEKVNDGKLGLKSNSGFYKYPLKEAPANIESIPESITVLEKIISWYLDGVFDVYERFLCTQSELEHIISEYMMVDKSPFKLAEEIGYTPK